MGYDQIAENMTNRQLCIGTIGDKLVQGNNAKYMHMTDELMRIGESMKLTLDYLGISPNSRLLGKILDKDTALRFGKNNNIMIAARTVLMLKNRYILDMRRKPWLYYDYCFDNYTYQVSELGLYDISYAIYELNKKHKFIEPEFDKYIEATIGLIANTISNIMLSFTNADIVRVWRLINVFGNLANDNKLLEDKINNALGDGLTDSLCDLYYSDDNASRESLIEYISTYDNYAYLIRDFLTNEEDDMQHARNDRTASIVDRDKLKGIIKQVLSHFKYKEDGRLLDYIIDSFYATFDFEHGWYDEAIAAWVTLQLFGDDDYINQIRRYAPWELYALDDTLYIMNDQCKCWSIIDTYKAYPIIPNEGKVRKMISDYFEITKKSFTLTDLMKFIAYLNVAYDVYEPDNVETLLKFADDCMRTDVSGEFLNRSCEHIGPYKTVLNYKIEPIDFMLRLGDEPIDVLNI